MDNPEKAPYEISDIECFGGFDVEDFLHATSSEKYKYIGEMQAWIIKTKCRYFGVLMDYARATRSEDWHPLLCDSCGMLMRAYIQSKAEQWKEQDTMIAANKIENEVTSDADSQRDTEEHADD